MSRYKPAHRAPRHRGPRVDGKEGRSVRAEAGRLRRRRRIKGALGAVVLIGIGVSTGTVIGARGRPGAGAPGNSTETEPAVTTPASVVSGPPGQPSRLSAGIQVENGLPGSADWKLTDRADNHEIEGYASQVSVNQGDRFNLYVSTIAPSFHVEVYRMGYYQGRGARLVETSPESPGDVQAAAGFTAGINMVEASWQPSLALATASWPQGDYLLKLVASTGKQRYVPMTVRSDSSTAAFVVINAVTTWQAYNLWGGSDLYEGPNGGGSDYAHRSRTVSFDRPYTLGDGAGDFLGLEYPLVSLIESLGLDVTYLTDIDLQHRPNPLLGHKAVVSPGHDEYYSMAMRQALEQARDQSVNLAFLGANAVFRHIRLSPSPLGPDRHEVDYKSARGDPLNDKNNADVTVSWRDPPNSNPESQLIGNFYQCNPVRADMVVVDPNNWLFEGSGATVGQKLHGVVGSEYDRYDPTVPGPPNVEILTHSPLRCRGNNDFADATYYSAPSGAGVFASGTTDWVSNMDTHCEPADCAGRVLGRVMANLLSVFGTGPAGLVHPSAPDQSTERPRPPVPASVPKAGGA